MKTEKTAKDFEGRSVYERMIAVFFDSNPVEDLNDTVDHEFMGYGTAAHEFFNEKKVLMEIARTQSDQFRNSNIKVNRKLVHERSLAKGATYLIVEEFDFHDLDIDHHYRMRLSTILEKTDDRWLVSHMHGSTPDSNIAEEEALPMEGLRRKNRELEEIIKEGIREAELEAALERIRSSSLAMRKPDDLRDVVTVLFDQMQELSVDMGFASVSIFIFEEGTRNFTQWLPLPEGVTSLHVPYIDHPISSDLFDARESGTDYFEKVYSVEEKNAWVEKGFELTDYKNLPGEFKTSLLEAPGYAMSISLAKHSGICIPSFEGKLPSPENVAILKQVGKVFEQAYTRFLDLQKAEAQTREAKIEAALEKVRSRTMAMHKSKELKDVVKEIFDQLAHLSVNAEHAGIVVDYEPEKDWHFWIAETQDIPAMVTVPYLNLVWDRQFTEAKREGKPFFTTQLNFDEKNSFYKKLLPHIEGLNKEASDFYFSCPGLAISTTIEEDIGLYIENFSGTPYSGEENEILKRFGKVFQQAYTRFLDLQKAEAQAREAQIVASIERVRAATMAMHQSDELSLVLSKLFEQFDVLGIKPSHAVLTLIDKEKNTMNFRTTGKNGYQVLGEQEVDLSVMNAWVDTAEKWKKSDPNAVNVNEFPPEILPEVWEVYKDILATMPQKARPEIKDFPDGLFITEGYCRFGYIGFAHHRKPSEEEKDIVRRIAAEFGSLYQRFLDLQKAEEQAREAQIETALERVRSRSLAMHKSDELNDVVKVVFEKMTDLEVPSTAVAIQTFTDGSKDMQVFVCGDVGTGLVINQYLLPFFDHPIIQDYLDTHKKKPGFFVGSYSKKEKDSFYDVVLKRPELKDLPAEVKIMISESEVYEVTMVPAEKSLLAVNDFQGNPLSERQVSILKRFAKVFDQAYTRFLDLQKAEEQAREAQVNLAVERVRARAMAMQKSDELSDVIALISEQMDTLQIPVDDGVALITFDEDSKDLNEWMANEGFETATNFHLPYFDHPILSNLWEAKDQGQKELIHRYSAEESRSFLNHIFQHTDFSHTPEPVKEYCLAAETYATSIAFQKNTAIFINDYSGVSLSDSEMAILHRFAKEFDQTYTRFLDLQKAEAQAREAEVNLAVERVRAKALAMFKSEEILQVVIKLRNEILGLNIPNVTAATIHLKETNGMVRAWDLTSINNEEGQGLEISLDISYRLEDTHPDFFMREVWEKTDDYFVVIQGGDRYKHTSQWLRDNGHAAQAQEFEEFLESSQLDKAYHPTVQLNNGRMCIDMLEPPDPEVESILKKMAGAFDLAYKRFQDLQKAEEQARESEIQLALERVRARTMAMKKSDELREAVLVIYEQLEQLHFEATGCNIIIMDKESGSMQYWVSGFTQDIYPESYHVPFFNHPYLNAQIEPWKQGEMYAVMEYSGEEKKRFDEIFFSKTGFKNVPEQAKLAMKSLKMAKLSTAYCRYGALQVFGLEPLSEKKGEILRRFAKVFEQTYTRFLDLQKAEAQTREVQIEAALERARAQSMMMQHSDEINTISNAFHEQLVLLGIPSEFSYVWLPDEENQSHQFWASWYEIKAGDETLQSKQVTYPLDKSEPYTAACFAAWATPDVILEEFIPPQDITGFFDVWQELLSGAKKLKAEYFPEGIYYSEAYMRYGCFGINIRRKLSEEEKNILKRFSKEFERAYTRFLDLQKAEEQARLIREERDRLEIALNKLEATQDQLIQQEKLASLGQLTAGIAHEIKNPLNFVNNFSDVSIELVEEAREEIRRETGDGGPGNSKSEQNNSPLKKGDKGGCSSTNKQGSSDENKNSDLILEILDDIEANLRKIHEHGSRADSIVKSMLQHSRGGDGKMEPTPLNPIIKEYVNLAFHGMRAGNEPINVDIDLQLDENVGEVPLVAEDFSRVILNLTNNAFDAMRDKLTGDGGPGSGYVPKLTVRTNVDDGKVTIEIEDNGPGIPDEIKDKIMQPFFTTKKGTQGTGLGLSITNDIVKAHGGTMNIDSQPGQTIFTIKFNR